MNFFLKKEIYSLNLFFLKIEIDKPFTVAIIQVVAIAILNNITGTKGLGLAHWKKSTKMKLNNIYKNTSGYLRPQNETSNSSVRGLLLRCCSMTKVTKSMRLLRPVL